MSSRVVLCFLRQTQVEVMVSLITIVSLGSLPMVCGPILVLDLWRLKKSATYIFL